MRTILFFFIALGILTYSGCSTDIKVNGPQKDIYVVYGVLDKTRTYQMIRIMKAFLIEGNAIDYSKSNDLSVKGLKVTLTSDEATPYVYEAQQIDTLLKNPQDGLFYSTTTAYKFYTGSNNKPYLKDGRKYTLKITDPNNPSLEITAYTYIPQKPTIISPQVNIGAGQTKCVNHIQLWLPFEVTFKRHPTGSASTKVGAGYGFELRAYFEYYKNGIAKRDTFLEPYFVFDDPTGLSVPRCNFDASSGCYSYEAKSLLRNMKTKMNDDNAVYTYKDAPDCSPSVDSLATPLQFEVTAIDTFLTKYMLVNDPKYTDFNSVKAEYTNLKGTKDVYGIFGSINKDIFTKNVLDECSMYLLRLNGQADPNNAGCKL
jgi:hypothetical protein